MGPVGHLVSSPSADGEPDGRNKRRDGWNKWRDGWNKWMDGRRVVALDGGDRRTVGGPTGRSDEQAVQELVVG